MGGDLDLVADLRGLLARDVLLAFGVVDLPMFYRKVTNIVIIAV